MNTTEAKRTRNIFATAVILRSERSRHSERLGNLRIEWPDLSRKWRATCIRVFTKSLSP